MNFKNRESLPPRDKAKKLLESMYADIDFGMEDCSFTYRPDEFIVFKLRTAKKCATRLVDEILTTDPLSPSKLTGEKTSKETYQAWEGEAYSYWEDVKKELEQL